MGVGSNSVWLLLSLCVKDGSGKGWALLALPSHPGVPTRHTCVELCAHESALGTQSSAISLLSLSTPPRPPAQPHVVWEEETTFRSHHLYVTSTPGLAAVGRCPFKTNPLFLLRSLNQRHKAKSDPQLRVRTCFSVTLPNRSLSFSPLLNFLLSQHFQGKG